MKLSKILQNYVRTDSLPNDPEYSARYVHKKDSRWTILVHREKSYSSISLEHFLDGKLNNPDSKTPAMIEWYGTGEMRGKAWFKDGVLHNLSSVFPAATTWFKDGRVEREEWRQDGLPVSGGKHKVSALTRRADGRVISVRQVMGDWVYLRRWDSQGFAPTEEELFGKKHFSRSNKVSLSVALDWALWEHAGRPLHEVWLKDGKYCNPNLSSPALRSWDSLGNIVRQEHWWEGKRVRWVWLWRRRMGRWAE